MTIPHVPNSNLPCSVSVDFMRKNVRHYTIVNNNCCGGGALFVSIGGGRLIAFERRITCLPYARRRLWATSSRSLGESVGRLEDSDGLNSHIVRVLS